MRLWQIIFLLTVLAFVCAGCLKREEFPDEPRIEYIGTTLRTAPSESAADSIGFISFSFTDGDGDLGLNQGDTLGQFARPNKYHWNLFVHYFEFRDTGFTAVPQVDTIMWTRFKNLTPTGGDKSLQGKMDVGIFASPAIGQDSFRYQVYIVDRALNHSDTIVTEGLFLPY